MSEPRAALSWACLVVAGVLLLAAAAPGAERWGWLGVRIRDLSESEMEELTAKLGLREGYGVVIADVIKETPAEAAGVRPNDIVVAIDGRPVIETRALQRIVGGAATGREVGLVVLRDGRRRELRVRVGEMPPDAVAERVAAEFGFLVREATAEEQGTSERPRLPVVAVVAERSAAARGGLLVGDRVLAVDGTRVGSVEALRGRLQGVELRQELRLAVMRQGEPRELVLPPAVVALPTQ